MRPVAYRIPTLTLRALLTLTLMLLTALALAAWQLTDLGALLQTWLQTLDTGAAALLFMLLFALASALLLPNSLFMLIGGAWFGLYWGFVINLVGFGIGAIATFLLARYLAHDYVAARMPARVVGAMEQVHASGWKLVAVLRLCGVVPAVLINYAFGITPIRWQTYAWASVVFTVPNCLILTYAGVAGEDFINNGDMGTALTAVGLVALAALAASVFRRRYFFR